MDKRVFVVCFWMMFLRYLEGFCQKTKYRLGADTMRISQVFKNLRYHINSDQNLMDFWPDIPVKRNDRYRRTSCPSARLDKSDFSAHCLWYSCLFKIINTEDMQIFLPIKNR